MNESYRKSGQAIRKIMENEPERLENAAKAAAFLMKGRSPMKCHYCENEATKNVVWLKDKRGADARIRLPWCGCDLMTALRKIWPCPYQVIEGRDYTVEDFEKLSPLTQIEKCLAKEKEMLGALMKRWPPDDHLCSWHQGKIDAYETALKILKS